ncbi:MAG: MFS transporter [Planctomycetes bacterium]|nr:MFS transporter [Planctomycetota bacterium]
MSVPHDPCAAIRHRSFRRFLTGNFLTVLGTQMQSVAVGWEIYQRTRSNWCLAYVGLVQFLPVVLFVLPAGHVADTFDRRRVAMVSAFVMMAASCGLAWASTTGAGIGWMYAFLAVTGTARAFQQPAKASLAPQLVPLAIFSNAVTWGMGSFHLASVLGPALGGFTIAWCGGAALVYGLDALAAASFIVCLMGVTVEPSEREPKAVTFRDLAAGFAFLGRNQVVLGAITLDMFAVLLGGAVTLLPVYADDILHVGPEGLGWLRSAPAVGALLMSVVLARRPPFRNAGVTLLWAVVGFGAATIVFGLSRHFGLSLAMLFLTGAFDNISVVIRHTLVQVLTPNHLRGRVSAINSLFIGASNELGGFESGAVAGLLTPTWSVVSGGVGTIVVVAAVAFTSPRLRRYKGLGSEPVE